MTKQNEIYEKYDLLLPSKFEGGYLIIALYDKIKNEEIAEQFTITDIRNILDEISRKYNSDSVPQPERILKMLLHYYIRNSPKAPGKYYLTDRTRKLVDFLKSILENSYKDFPLKKSFEKSFSIVPNEIQTIDDLEYKFGRGFIEEHKKIIIDHLEGLDEELIEGYAELNKILESDDESATTLVNRFTLTFRKFGDRAEDITNSIASKDRCLKDLQVAIEYFYSKIENFKHPESQNDLETLNQLKVEYQKANDIYLDIETFFKTIDEKLDNIRHRIYNASGKLSELHEQFTARAHLRLQIKRLLKITLHNASYSNDGIIFNPNYPLKKIVHEDIVFFHPGYHDFNMSKPNIIIRIPPDEAYEKDEYQKIAQENNQHEIINKWVKEACNIFDKDGFIILKYFVEKIISEEKDFSIAYQVAGELKQEILIKGNTLLQIKKELTVIKDTDLWIWKTQIVKS